MAPEFAIVGRGLAGTALAWALLRRGRRVLVVDSGHGGSSRVAAGLITPVTGKRMAESWRWHELYPAAVGFYRAIETQVGKPFFHQRPALRLFVDEAERTEFRRRESKLCGLAHLAEVPACFDAPFGGFEMPDAARLDVPLYLDASRDHFRSLGAYRATNVLTSPLEGEVAIASPQSRVGGEPRGMPTSNTARTAHFPSRVAHPPPAGTEDGSSGLHLKGGGEELAGTTIWCRGFTPILDPLFGAVRFNAAKGEMLTLRVPGLSETRVVHRGVWLAPFGGDLFRVGATYTWDPLDALPTPEGRAEIETKLRAFLKLPFQVIDHSAGVRPVIDAGYPVLGRHPNHPNHAYFNGLGSKGSLLAPFFAEQLAAHLCGEGDIDEKVSVGRFLVPAPPTSG